MEYTNNTSLSNILVLFCFKNIFPVGGEDKI